MPHRLSESMTYKFTHQIDHFYEVIYEIPKVLNS
jgi:hypothetical protein